MNAGRTAGASGKGVSELMPADVKNGVLARCRSAGHMLYEMPLSGLMSRQAHSVHALARMIDHSHAQVSTPFYVYSSTTEDTMQTLIKSMVLLLCFTCTACSWLHRGYTLEDTPHYLDIAGEKYRKAGAPNVDILRIGIKKNDLFVPQFMPVVGDAVPVYLSTEIFSEQTRKAAIGLGGKAGNELARIEAGAGVTTDRSSQSTYKLFTIRDVHQLVAALNRSENASSLETMMRYDEPRIVIGVAVAFSHTSQINATTEGSLGLKISKFTSAPEITFTGSNAQMSTVKLSDGTVFAYKLARICWEDNAAGGLRVSTVDMDMPKVSDNECPDGTFKNLHALRASMAVPAMNKTAR
jgi:hypothetical protein